MLTRCKCHGMSGSCQLKTCWKNAPDFRAIGRILKQLFRNAILVNQSNTGNREPLVIAKKAFHRKHAQRSFNGAERRPSIRLSQLEDSLFYYQRSPNFCERNSLLDIQGEWKWSDDFDAAIWLSSLAGTIGRRCNRTSSGNGSCSTLCCGRGFHLIKESRNEKCMCKFHWCCFVECQECVIEEWISVCK